MAIYDLSLWFEFADEFFFIILKFCALFQSSKWCSKPECPFKIIVKLAISMDAIQAVLLVCDRSLSFYHKLIYIVFPSIANPQSYKIKFDKLECSQWDCFCRESSNYIFLVFFVWKHVLVNELLVKTINFYFAV